MEKMKYGNRQLLIFCSLYISYTLYVYVRRSFSYTIPVLAAEGNLNKKDLGLIVSSQSLAYTISKFCCGILVDFVSPKLLLSSGLILSGITAICFTGFETVTLLSVWWFLNGLSQGPGWSAIAAILKKWTTAEQLGTVWSVMSTSMNLAGTVGPILTAFIITWLDWQSCIQMAGCATILFGFVCFALVKDSPGHSQISQTENMVKKEEVKKKQNNAEEIKSNMLSRKELLFLPGFLGICVCYFATSAVQYGILQWATLFMVQEKKQPVLLGSAFLSSVDMGGIVGSFVAGFLSDHMVSKNADIPKHIVRKVLLFYFLVLLGTVMYIFTIYLSENSSKIFVTLVGFLCGFGIYGPISLFGVIAIETAPDHMSGTAHAIACVFSNVGMMSAGLPMSYMASISDWKTTFLAQVTMIIIMVTYLFMKLRKDLSNYTSKSGSCSNVINILFSK